MASRFRPRKSDAHAGSVEWLTQTESRLRITSGRPDQRQDSGQARPTQRSAVARNARIFARISGVENSLPPKIRAKIRAFLATALR